MAIHKKEKPLKSSPFSPLTKKPLKINDATPNYALKSMIEKYLNGGEKPLKNEQCHLDIKSKINIKEFKAEVIDDPTSIKNVFVNISIKPEKLETRKPLVLIAMIDVSGSMEISSSEGMKGGEEAGISRLGLVKHALKTVALTLNKDDKMSLITFSSKADICLEATNADDIGKNIIFEEIKKMEPDG